MKKSIALWWPRGLMVVCAFALSGCGLAAAPTDACADVIDP
ncbi:hypothetical protein PWP93_08525 [Paraburkholderia sp. A1RI-2L]